MIVFCVIKGKKFFQAVALCKLVGELKGVKTSAGGNSDVDATHLVAPVR